VLLHILTFQPQESEEKIDNQLLSILTAVPNGALEKKKDLLEVTFKQKIATAWSSV